MYSLIDFINNFSLAGAFSVAEITDFFLSFRIADQLSLELNFGSLKRRRSIEATSNL